MSTRSFLMCLAVGSLLPLTASHARIVTVYPGAGNISWAVEHSLPDDTLMVTPGVYPYEVGASVRHNLTILGVGGPEMNDIRVCGDLCGGALVVIWADTPVRVLIDGVSISPTEVFPGYGAIEVFGTSHTTVRNCIFRGTRVLLDGTANARIEHNLFIGNVNTAQEYGLSVYYSGTGDIRGNTFTQLPHGILLYERVSPTIANNILAFNDYGISCIGYSTPTPDLRCNDVWRNSERNYLGCDDPTGTNGNIAADPLFCDLPSLDLRLRAGSPCLPENSPSDCGLIGALGPCELVAAGSEVPPVSAANLTVSPNPCTSTAEFSIAVASAPFTLEIIDPQGRLMALLTSESPRLSWSLPPHAPRGVYFARLRSKQLSDVVKFVVTR